MMGGAQSIKKDDEWYEIFDFINGKFFNFYSYFDGALQAYRIAQASFPVGKYAIF